MREWSNSCWPTEIRIEAEGEVLRVSFDDGNEYALSAELLRVESPSAEVQGHGIGQKITISGKRLVRILGVEQVGNYAIKITFNDLHDTGIYTWKYLHELGENQEKIWEDYFERLLVEGLGRDP
ncbi:MAG: hypothetical protein CMM58_06040 [Rhodospirillaceae bacterium]|nr:hypothetical protein [Rhodospirillaceae bacterium]